MEFFLIFLEEVDDVAEETGFARQRDGAVGLVPELLLRLVQKGHEYRIVQEPGWNHKPVTLQPDIDRH